MPTFNSTRTIFRVEDVNVQSLEGTTIAAGSQLTAVTLTIEDPINPNASASSQQNDARSIVGATFSNFQGQGRRFGPSEEATLRIEGVEVAQRVPDLSGVSFQGQELRSDVVTDGGILDFPLFFEIDGTLYLVPTDVATDVSGITEITTTITLNAPSFNQRIFADTTDFVPFNGDGQPAPVDPAPVDPAPVDPAPVDPNPVDPDPVEPAPAPINVINGTGRRDFLSGTSDADEINGGGGRDNLLGRGGDDILNGGSGRDNLRGGSGDDVLNGGTGRDDLRGGSGNDTLDGGAGNDLLVGGRGADTFVFATGTGDDVIRGFESDDVIDLTAIESLNSFADVENALTQTRFGTVLDLDNGDSVFLARVSVDTLASDDFLF